MKSIKKLVARLIVVSMVVLGAAQAWGIKVMPSGVEPGFWTKDFAAAKEYADKTDTPILVFWGSDGCGYCSLMTKYLGQAPVANWIAEHPIVLVWYEASASQTGVLTEVKKFAKGSNESGLFPYMRMYWKKGGVDKSFTGRSGKLPVKTGSNTSEQMAASLEKYFGAWKPVPDYAGGSFSVKETEGNRLEAEAGTTRVTIELVRDEEQASVVTNAMFVARKPDGSKLTSQTVTWKAGQTNATLSVSIPSGTFKTAGEQITLTMESGGEAHSTNHITYVARENSASNPLWLTERTVPGATLQAAGLQAATSVPALDFGEWTMDIEGAKALAKGASGSAYVLVSVQGSLWCPDCANTERNFLDLKDASGKNRFAAWAKEHQIALASVDIPNFTGLSVADASTPCLLSRTGYETTIARENEYPQSGAEEALTKPVMRSGLGYLTRKEIVDEAAAAQLAKFHDLVTQNTDQGGLHRPEDGNKFRTGVPIFVLLRKDGSVAARLTRLASVSPMKADQANFDNYLKRIEEMMAIADADATEIENNYPGAGAIEFKANGGQTSGEISNTDFQDVFKLSGVGGNALQKVEVKGDTTAEVGVQFMKLDADGVAQEIGEIQYGRLSDGVALEETFTDAGDYYVVVKGKSITSDAFDVASASSTFNAFTVKGNVVFVPQEQRATGAAPEDSDKIVMRLVKDQFYRIEGIKGDACADVLTPQQPGQADCKFYTAKKDGDYELTTFYGKGGTVSYQVWKPGEVGFVTPSKSMKENGGSVQVQVTRSSGVSGAVKVRVSIDPSTDLYDYWGNPRFVIADGVQNVEVQWLDGETYTTNFTVSVKNDDFYDGNGKLVLRAEVIEDENGDTVVTNETFTLNVVEDDKQLPGRAMVTGADPFFSQKLTVFARRSEGATVRLGRVEAADGLVGVLVTASDKTVKLEAGDGNDGLEDVAGYRVRQTWANRDQVEKVVRVTNLPAAGKTVKVSLTAESGSNFKVVSASNYVNVVSVADDAPAFAMSAAEVKLSRYVVSSNSFPLVSTQGGVCSFTKVLGTLPSGLKVTYDPVANAMVLAGAPTAKPGTTRVVYRVAEKRGKTKVGGLTIELTLKLTDPTDVKGNPEGANAAVQKSRTFKTLPLVDMVQKRLVGTVQVTLPTKGNASAKMVCAEGTISFSAKSWSAFDDETLALTTTLQSRAGDQMIVVAAADGSVALEVARVESEGVLTTLTDGTLWSKTKPATDWKGYYTVALPVAKVTESIAGLAPVGTGYLTLKMDTTSAINKGEVKWAGVLPNGTAVSGSATLVPDMVGFTLDGDPTGCGDLQTLPLFKKSTRDIFSALACLKPDAVSKSDRRSVLAPVDVVPFWRHTEKDPAAQADFDVTFHLYGGLYDKAEDLGGCCQAYYATTQLALHAVVDDLFTLAGDAFANVTDGQLTVSSSSMKLDPASKVMTISLNRSTGIVSGRVTLQTVDASRTFSCNWKGVVLTGWGDRCGCGDGNEIFMPFVNGAFTFKDTLSYINAKGKTVKLSVVRGNRIKAE